MTRPGAPVSSYDPDVDLVVDQARPLVAVVPGNGRRRAAAAGDHGVDQAHGHVGAVRLGVHVRLLGDRRRDDSIWGAAIIGLAATTDRDKGGVLAAFAAAGYNFGLLISRFEVL